VRAAPENHRAHDQPFDSCTASAPAAMMRVTLGFVVIPEE